jgi:HIRAN domain
VPRELTLFIAGADFPNRRGPTRRFELKLCAPGEPVELRPEPRNPADPNAIAVFSARGVQLGYVPAERAPWIGGIMKQGREVMAIFQGETAPGGWMRIGLDGRAPTLPPVKPAPFIPAEPDSETGFYPDEIYPDD